MEREGCSWLMVIRTRLCCGGVNVVGRARVAALLAGGCAAITVRLGIYVTGVIRRPSPGFLCLRPAGAGGGSMMTALLQSKKLDTQKMNSSPRQAVKVSRT